MPYLVNGQIVPEDLIRREVDRLGRDPHWQTIPDAEERSRLLREAAERSATDAVLIDQLAANDPRPIEADLMESEIERVKTANGCRAAFDDTAIRTSIERHLRVERFRREMVEGARKPADAEIESLYAAHRFNFQRPELFRAAHIVKYVNEMQSFDEALFGIKVALEEVQSGAQFSDVADRYSDCKDKGGYLGRFPAGHMVHEFEEVLRKLEPGQHSGIVQTPFGLHIAMLIERLPAGPADFEDVRPEIERVLAFANQHALFMEKIAELRASADIRHVAENRRQEAAS